MGPKKVELLVVKMELEKVEKMVGWKVVG